jgi:hypothetical protein
MKNQVKTRVPNKALKQKGLFLLVYENKMHVVFAASSR